MNIASTSFYETPMASNTELPPSPNASRTHLNDPVPDDNDNETRRHADSSIPIAVNTQPPDDVHTTTITSDPTPSGQTHVRRKGLWPTLARPLGSFHPTLVLENSGSVARDHLASERTFLAYVRTSLTIASAGIALFQLFALSNTTSDAAIHKYSRPIGATVVALGIVVLVLGVVRYFAVQVALVKGVYPVARVSPAFVAFALLAVVFVVFGILLGIRNSG